jgi:hypothetical protein
VVRRLPLLLLLPLTACDLHPECSSPQTLAFETHVEVRLLDPRQVALSLPDGRTILPARAGPSDAPFTSGVLRTGPFTSGRYDARVTRDADGALGITWDTDIPMLQGRHQIVVASNGSLQPFYGEPRPLPGEPGAYLPGVMTAAMLDIPDRLGADNLELTLCPKLVVQPRGGALASAGPCSDASSPRVRLSTPWKNVAFVREESEDSFFGVSYFCRQHKRTVVVYPPQQSPAE